MSASPDRLQIAARIHFMLLREIGQGIDIEQMLGQPRYERDVLLVCDACRDSELANLARQYRQTMAPAVPAPAAEATRPGGHAPRPNEWSRATTGFGISRPFDPLADSAAGDRGNDAAGTSTPSLRHRLARWLRR